MFFTDDANNLPIGADPSLRGRYLWSRVEMATDMPWLHASINYVDDGVERESCLFTAVTMYLAPERLPKLHGVRLTEVRLVSPGWLNGTGTWQMSPLREIRSGTYQGRDLMMFGLQDGRWLVEDQVPFSALANHEVHYFFDRAARK